MKWYNFLEIAAVIIVLFLIFTKLVKLAFVSAIVAVFVYVGYRIYTALTKPKA